MPTYGVANCYLYPLKDSPSLLVPLLFLQIDDNTISTLPSNFFVNNLLATMALTDDKPVTKKISCDNCDSEDDAQSRCNECGIFLCQFCTDSHKRYRSTKHHELYTMQELKLNARPQKIAETIRCTKHKEEVIKLFCKTCQITICRDCTIVDHRQHEYGFVEEVAVEEKKHLQKNLKEVEQRKGRVVQGIVDLRNFNERLDKRYLSTVSEINRHFDFLAKAVELRRREMMKKATLFTKAKQKQIRTQLDVLEVALASCESSIEFTEQAFKNGNNVQILSMEKYILQSLEHLKAVKDQTKPCVTEDMEFITPSSVQEAKEELLEKCDVYVTAAYPGNCNAFFIEKEKKLNVGKQYSITLVCHDKYNRRLEDGGQHIKPLFTGMQVSDVVITDLNDGSYTIGFCPHQGGMLKFMVYVNGRLAPKCSLSKQVKWFISDVHGKGSVCTDGLLMYSEGGYCCRVGSCYFDSGVHKWKVELSNTACTGYTPRNVETGIIDYDDINADIASCENKWVYERTFNEQAATVDVFVTLNMDKKTVYFETQKFSNNPKSAAGHYQFTASRVSPFFASDSLLVCIRLRE